VISPPRITPIPNNERVAALGDNAQAFLVQLPQPREIKILRGKWPELPSLNDHTIIRAGWLSEHESQLKKIINADYPRVITVLKGMGGVGKTTLAAHIAHHAASVFRGWFTAKTPEILQSEYFAFGVYYGVFDADTALDLKNIQKGIKDYIESGDQEVLLVFDDAQSFAEIQDFLPKKNARIFITSRTPHWQVTGVDIVDVYVMIYPEAKALYQKITKRNDTDEHLIPLLTRKLYHLPLAISQAAYFLKTNETTTLENYIEMYDALDTTLFDNDIFPEDDKRDDTYEEIDGQKKLKTVVITWLLNFRKISSNPNAELLFYACLFLEALHIPEDFLKQFLGIEKKLTDHRVLEVQYILAKNIILDYSLLKYDASRKMFSIHPLVQEVARKNITNPIIKQKILLSLLDFILKQMSQDGYIVVTKQGLLLAHFERLAEHAKTLEIKDLLVAKAFNKLALIYIKIRNNAKLNQGEVYLLTRGETYLNLALEMQKSLLPTEENLIIVDTLENLGLLASTHANKENIKKGASYIENALAIKRKLTGVDDFSISLTLIYLGSIYKKIMGRSKDALKCYKTALMIQRNLTNLSELNRIPVFDGIARMHINRHGPKHAMRAVRYAMFNLKVLVQHLGVMHPRVMYAIHIISTAYSMYQGKDHLNKAIQCLNIALHMAENLFGAESLQVADCLNELAEIYHKLNDETLITKALEYAKHALRIKRDYLPADHSDILVNLYAVGLNFLREGSQASLIKARDYYQELFEKWQKKSRFCPMLEGVLINLGIVCLELKTDENLRAAIEYFSLALAARPSKENGSKDEITKYSYFRALADLKLHKTLSALPLLKKSITYLKANPPDKFDRIYLLRSLPMLQTALAEAKSADGLTLYKDFSAWLDNLLKDDGITDTPTLPHEVFLKAQIPGHLETLLFDDMLFPSDDEEIYNALGTPQREVLATLKDEAQLAIFLNELKGHNKEIPITLTYAAAQNISVYVWEQVTDNPMLHLAKSQEIKSAARTLHILIPGGICPYAIEEIDAPISPAHLVKKISHSMSPVVSSDKATKAAPPDNPLDSSSDDETAQAISKSEAETKKVIGPRFIKHWNLYDVKGDGNCFYYAVIDQLQLLKHPFLKQIPLTRAPHDFLRSKIQGTSYHNREWAGDDEIEKTAHELNIVIAIINTTHPDSGYTYYYFNKGETLATINVGQITTPPPDQQVIKLAFTGNHFLSVRQEPQPHPEHPTFFPELATLWLIEHRHDTPELQAKYDTLFGITCLAL
jgi:tetratricopeptide (TPR) repeat protein